jgi:hypothetical protein
MGQPKLEVYHFSPAYKLRPQPNGVDYYPAYTGHYGQGI